LHVAEEQRGHTFGPMRYPSLAESVLAEVRRAIINGDIGPGDRLVETDLAEQFQVSRATIRQALAQLKVESLVDVRPRRGVVVTRMSRETARDVCTVRGLLEGWAARTACRVLTETQLESMFSMSAQMGECVRKSNVYGMMEIDIELHSLICRCEANPYLWERWQSLNSLLGALIASRLAYYNYDPIGVVQRHQELVSTLSQRDPDSAESAVRHHYIARFLNGQEEPATSGIDSLYTLSAGRCSENKDEQMAEDAQPRKEVG
jgi:DNA-binding GntR family transcriptional regulator